MFQGYLEKLYGKTLSELRILLNEPFIISSVAVVCGRDYFGRNLYLIYF